MNDVDRHHLFNKIFAILDADISQWTYINVQQFLHIINCGEFQKLIRKWGVTGQMLLEPSKIQAILIPQLKPSTILLYQKLMFILEELKPTEYRKSDFTMQRHSRDTLSIPGNLMKAFRMGIDAIAKKNMVLWSTQDLITFLKTIGFAKFQPIVRLTSSDGMIMLYVVSDRRKMNRMSKNFESKQLQQIVYISHIMLAQYYMFKNELDDQLQQIELDPQIYPDIVFNLKKVQSMESINEPPQQIMLTQSMESVYEQNDFIMIEEADNGSVLQPIDNFESPIKDKKSTSLQNGENLTDSEKSKNQQPLAVSQFPEQQSESFDQSVYYNKQQQMDKSQYAESQMGKSQYPDRNSYLAQSCYAESVRGSVIRNSGKVEQDNLAQSLYDNNMACSEFPIENDDFSLSTDPTNASNKTKQEFSFEQNLTQNQSLAEFNEIKKQTLSMPFDLMNFKHLNSITLKELIYRHDSNDDNSVDGKQTFGAKGCRFGRDSNENVFYCYPDEKSISGKHAMIFFKQNKFYLQDLGSKTGTFKQINQIEIYDGLLIQLAFQIEITFQIIQRENHQGIIKVIFKNPEQMPKYQAILPEGMSCRVGRSPNSKILIDSNFISVSQKHAQIEYRNKKFFFKDLKSQNGSWLRLSGKGIKSDLLPLEVGDIFRISSKKKFRVEQIHISNLDL